VNEDERGITFIAPVPEVQLQAVRVVVVGDWFQ
jgi:hypothetical protein